MKNYFEGAYTESEIKSLYRKLAIKNHPDVGGSTEIMAEINRQYEKALAGAVEEHQTVNEYTSYKDWSDLDGGFREVVEKLIKIVGIDVEICGNWIWVSGNTRPVKDEIKAAGCKWSKNKNMWYWRPSEYRSFRHKSKSMEYIRDKYGSSKITFRKQLEA